MGEEVGLEEEADEPFYSGPETEIPAEELIWKEIVRQHAES